MIAHSGPKLLMCKPEHFGVLYSINPWMDPREWARRESALAVVARREWAALHQTLCDLGAEIEFVPAEIGLPDLVFTANAAVVLDRKVLLARFRHPQRRAEEKYFDASFRSLQARGFVDEIVMLPEDSVLEGAGDCVFDQSRNLFWLGYGPRSDEDAQVAVARTFDIDTVALELAEPRFYHMDTALCALPGGEIMYFPDAFTAEGQATIEARVTASKRIVLDEEDAALFAANNVCIGDTLVMSACSEKLRITLADQGYRVAATPLTSFLRSGGSAFCLTLRLDRLSATEAERRERPLRQVSASLR